MKKFGDSPVRKFVLLIASVLISAQAGLAEEYSFDFHRVFETTGEVTLDLTYLEGDLIITGNNYDELVVDGKKRVNAVNLEEAELIQDHIEIKAKQSGDKVEVSTNYLRVRDRGRSFWDKVLGRGGSSSFGKVDWTISVPDNCNIIVTNTTGKIEISQQRGSVSIQSSASDIILTSLEGNVSVENGSGKTTGDLIFGDVEIRQPQGEIDLKWIEGNVRLKSSSADIKLLQEAGSIDLTTSTGKVDIRTNLDSSRDFVVRTETGSINLVIPESSSGMLDIRSESGEIRSEIPIAIKSMSHQKVVGEFGFGGVKVSLSSISGDVTVAQF